MGYTYDANGALTADPTRTYAYDAFGRLVSSTVGATTTTYTLDGAGRRLAETTALSTTSFDLDLRSSLATIRDAYSALTRLVLVPLDNGGKVLLITPDPGCAGAVGRRSGQSRVRG